MVLALLQELYQNKTRVFLVTGDLLALAEEEGDLSPLREEGEKT